MVPYKKEHQGSVIPNKSVTFTEFFRVSDDQFRMIPPPAFGNVMKKSGNIEQPMPVETRHQSAAKGIFVSELDHREATKIPDDHEYVLVNGINVEKVVLHLSHDFSECRQVTPKNRVLIHSSQLMHDSAWLLKQCQKLRFIDWIATEAVID